ncbi:MAG: hypothetical protein JOY51_09255, partial [Nevskia sp.]|nr:hypothetical protein [Nevskia sp.]
MKEHALNPVRSIDTWAQRPTPSAKDTPHAALRAALLEVLDTAIAVTGAARGNVQLFNRRSDGLEIVAERGFPKEFLELFA